MSEDEHDEAERREAEALARALERGHALDDLPEEALQTAALLRYSADGGELSEGRRESILDEVLEAADRAAAKQPEAAATPWWRWTLGLVGAGAAVALLLLFVVRPNPDPTALPAPTAALVGAQIDRLQGDDDGFDEAMQGYRGDVYAALEARYRR